MILLAKMRPGRSEKSGRRYFRGKDGAGNQIWLIEPRDATDAWELRLELSGQLQDVSRLVPQAEGRGARDALPLLDNQRSRP